MRLETKAAKQKKLPVTLVLATMPGSSLTKLHLWVYICDSRDTDARATVFDRNTSTDQWMFRPDNDGNLLNLGQPQDLSADGTILAFGRGVYQYDGATWNQMGNDITPVSPAPVLASWLEAA